MKAVTVDAALFKCLQDAIDFVAERGGDTVYLCESGWVPSAVEHIQPKPELKVRLALRPDEPSPAPAAA